LQKSKLLQTDGASDVQATLSQLQCDPRQHCRGLQALSQLLEHHEAVPPLHATKRVMVRLFEKFLSLFLFLITMPWHPRWEW
jgi:hypothetical protein